MATHHYFIVDYATGMPLEVFRSTLPGNGFCDGTLERAKCDGTWSTEEKEVRPLLNLWLKGDFDPEEDEVSEQEAHICINSWRSEKWPGRP
jgi:hypothetical protein